MLSVWLVCGGSEISAGKVRDTWTEDVGPQYVRLLLSSRDNACVEISQDELRGGSRAGCKKSREFIPEEVSGVVVLRPLMGGIYSEKSGWEARSG